MKADTEIPLFEEMDTGKFVAGILTHIPKPAGRRVFGATDWYTPTDMVSTIGRVSGKKTTFSTLPDEVFEGYLPPAIAKELAENFRFIDEFAYYGPGAKEGLADSLKVMRPLSSHISVRETDQFYSAP